MVTVSLCVCTRDRPADLERCLSSVAAGSQLPESVIVSDDGKLPADARAIVSSLGEPFVYVPGPRKGLSANRNNCIRFVSSSHVAFTDDDVVVPGAFVSSLVAAAHASEDAIVTGWERKLHAGAHVRITPHDADFWGLQRKTVRGSPRSIVINATVFPRRLFDRIRFDERLQYGSEEIDIAQHAAAIGTEIRFDEALWVDHRPSPLGRDEYAPAADASRIYQNVKRFVRYEDNWPRAIAFSALGPARLIAGGARHGGIHGAIAGARSAFAGISMAVDEARSTVRPGR
jgi:glycosyltransferase involved in cell wall biosynthesis